MTDDPVKVFFTESDINKWSDAVKTIFPRGAPSTVTGAKNLARVEYQNSPAWELYTAPKGNKNASVS